MENRGFYHFGAFLYRFRWAIIVLTLMVLAACVPFLPHLITPFKATGFIDESSPSAKAETWLNKKLGFSNHNKFMVLYQSDSLKADSTTFNKKIRNSLKDMEGFPLKYQILYPSENDKQISKDKHTAYAVITVYTTDKLTKKQMEDFKSRIKQPANMTMTLGGEAIFEEDVNEQTQTDLYKADFIAAPISLITLILVFGSVIAALIPVVLGGACAIFILTSLYLLATYVLSLSVFTINIALLLGLCLSLDYSLFIISRFREELLKQQQSEAAHAVKNAIATTQATAGHAILFSGLAVFASLSALLIFPVNILFSIGIGGLLAVFMAVIIAIFILPAILSIVGTRINWLSIHIWRNHSGKNPFWHRLAETVVGRPLTFFFLIFLFLLLLAWPMLFAKFGLSGFRIFPVHSEHRGFFDTYADKFDEKELSPITMVIQSDKKILSQNNLESLYDFVRKIKKNPLVDKVHSIVNLNSSLKKSQYYTLYQMKRNLLEPNIQKFLKNTTRHYMTAITVLSKYPVNSTQTKNLVTDLRNMKVPKHMEMQLTGTPVSNAELLDTIHNLLPYALLWIMSFTYLILLVLLRSVVLPLKAILMNILSLSAAYGALVLVFQEGYLHHLLDFDPQGMLDISLLVIIFCALFGFSMDYEVFLLTRIREYWLSSGDNKKSIVFGIEKSSRIITSAALIVIVICFSFLIADVLLVKAFGLGIAVAIFVDAFFIRTIFIPATMALLGKWNWYIPRWLDKILPKL